MHPWSSSETFPTTLRPTYCCICLPRQRPFRAQWSWCRKKCADRLAATAGTSAYGVLSATAQMHAHVEKLFTLPPGSIYSCTRSIFRCSATRLSGISGANPRDHLPAHGPSALLCRLLERVGVGGRYSRLRQRLFRGLFRSERRDRHRVFGVLDQQSVLDPQLHRDGAAECALGPAPRSPSRCGTRSTAPGLNSRSGAMVRGRARSSRVSCAG